MTRIYVSLPLHGPAAHVGRDLACVELALERANDAEVDLVLLDALSENPDVQAIGNAQRASADEAALAHIGELHSSQVARTTPILSRAGLLQIVPVATFVGLEGPTLVRLSPHDGVGAGAIAGWLARSRDRRAAGRSRPRQLVRRAGRGDVRGCRPGRGVTVRSRPVWDQNEDPQDDLGGAEAVLYVGVAGSGVVALWRDLHAANPALWLLGTEGVAQQWFGARRRRFFVAQRAPFAFYGFEAMSLTLDAVGKGNGDRDAVA